MSARVTEPGPDIIEGLCETCRRRHPGRRPGTFAYVDYRVDPPHVIKLARDGGIGHPVTPPPLSGPARRVQTYRIHPGKGVRLECGSCGAESRRSHKWLRWQAAQARAEGRTTFQIPAS